MLIEEELVLDSTSVKKDMDTYKDIGSKVLNLSCAQVLDFNWNNIVSVLCQSFKE